jgi:hypothetical protein
LEKNGQTDHPSPVLSEQSVLLRISREFDSPMLHDQVETVQELKSGYGIKVFELFLLDSSVNYDLKATISFRVAVARPEKNG